MSAVPSTPIVQVCVVARDAGRTARWWVDGLGMLPAGGTVFAGPLAERVQGVPGPLLRAAWALDRQGFFQVEVFRYARPRSRPRPPDWTPAHRGYSMVGVHVRDLDATLERLARLGSLPHREPLGAAGDRRVCVPDPDGNLVELYERDPLAGRAPPLERPDLGSTVRAMTVSVPDVEAFCARAERGLGLVREDGLRLHRPEHEAMWGLAGARRHEAVLRGGGVALEVVSYEHARGGSWPRGHRLSDLGHMNFAVGFRHTAEFDRWFGRARAEGWRPRGAPLEAGVFKVTYLDDPDGIDVEMLRPRAWADRLTGFAASVPYVVAQRRVQAEPRAVWERVGDLAGMASWSGLPVRVLTPGPAGAGTLREVRIAGATVTEEIVAWDPPHSYAYELTGGAPLADHHGEVHVLPQDGGARVRWAVRFRPRIPLTGSATAAVLRRRLLAALDGLAAAVSGG